MPECWQSSTRGRFPLQRRALRPSAGSPAVGAHGTMRIKSNETCCLDRLCSKTRTRPKCWLESTEGRFQLQYYVQSIVNPTVTPPFHQLVSWDTKASFLYIKSVYSFLFTSHPLTFDHHLSTNLKLAPTFQSSSSRLVVCLSYSVINSPLTENYLLLVSSHSPDWFSIFDPQ